MGKRNSSNGFQTRVWGPCAWLFLHTIGFNFKPEMADDYFRFFQVLPKVLPCRACRENFERILSGDDDPSLRLDRKVFASRDTVSFWLFRLHNQVQRGIHAREKKTKARTRPPLPDTRDEFRRIRERYEKYRANKCIPRDGCDVREESKRRKASISVRKV